MATSLESSKTEELTKMASYTGPTPTTRLRSNPKHFLTWSATVANNRIQKLSRNFVNNVSKLQSKMEQVMPAFHPPSSSPHNCNEQVENDLSEPYKDQQIHETCRISRVHKIPLSSSRNNCEKNECKTGSGLSKGLRSSNGDDDEEDANEERYSGFTPSTSYHASGDNNTTSAPTTTTISTAVVNSGGGSAMMVASKTGVGVGFGSATATTDPGFPHQVQVQSARIVQSHPIALSKQDTSSTAASVKTHKNLVQSGHYKIPPNPTITAEALKAMIINSPTELNSYRKYDEKPQPIKYVDVEVDVTSDVKNTLELQAIQHENQSKYNLSCGSSSGTSNSNNASLSERCNSPLRMNAPLPISSPQWSRTSSLSTYASSNAHNLQMPTSILKNALTNVENDYDKRNNNIGSRPPNFDRNMSSTSVDEISSQGIDNEGLTVTDHRPATVSFSSRVIESSDKASLLIKGKKSFTKRGKSNKNIQGSTKSNNNDKSSVAFQNPLSGSSSGTDRKHASVSPEAYPPSQLTVTIFEEEAELRHAPWFQAGIPRDIALEVLRNQPIGSFIVRESTTKAGCFALSLRVPKEFKRLGIAHYLILKNGRGYKIKGFTKEFKNLSSLITHHSVMPELLPCPLSLHRYRPNHPQKISRFNSSDFMEPEKLVGFTNFVDCLEKS